MEELIEQRNDLLNGCKAALGLIQLISSRHDLPDDLKNLMDSHRVKEAQAAIAKARQS